MKRNIFRWGGEIAAVWRHWRCIGGQVDYQNNESSGLYNHGDIKGGMKADNSYRIVARQTIARALPESGR